MQLKNYYYWISPAISSEDCQRIIDLGTSKIQEEEAAGHSTEAYTFGNHQKGAMGPDAVPMNESTFYELDKAKEKTYIRDSKVAWLTDQWLYDLIFPLIREANQKAGWNWEFDCAESFQFTQYNSPGGFYGWHCDGNSDWNGVYKRYIHGVTPEPLKANDMIPHGYTVESRFVGKVRKISMTINLNKPGDYEGGNLKFDFGVHTTKENRFHECLEIRPQGSMIVFPSFVYHCVTPVTVGTRYSLVLWALGDPWK
jgi:PKHD-type hydroxylase